MERLFGRPVGDQGWGWYFGYALGVVVTIVSVGLVVAVLGMFVLAMA